MAPQLTRLAGAALTASCTPVMAWRAAVAAVTVAATGQNVIF
jgi:hypothetical protein